LFSPIRANKASAPGYASIFSRDDFIEDTFDSDGGEGLLASLFFALDKGRGTIFFSVDLGLFWLELTHDS
jgi:hypothetical protein